MIASALVLALAVAVPQASQASRSAADTALASLVSAELAFAAHAAREGIGAAFSAYMADSSTMFAPDPVNGREWASSRPRTDARLLWHPAAARVSASGDFGFTTGPSEYRASPSDTAVHHGHFTSIWRRSSDGVWKVELDLGTPHERPRGRIPVFDPQRSKVTAQRPGSVAALPSRDAESLRHSLLALDSSLARTAAARGTAEAFDQFADPELRIHRPGSLPAVGRQRAIGALRREPGEPEWRPMGGGVAGSGDLGYTWGAVSWSNRGALRERGYYLRVWRRDAAGWHILLDAVTPRALDG